MKKIKGFILCWIHNSVLIYLASQVYKGKFVLGTKSLSLITAVIVSGFLVSLLLEAGSYGLAKIKGLKIEGLKRIPVFYILNFVSLWLVARIAPYSGFGVVRFTWLLLLGIFTTLVQILVSKSYKKE